MANLGKGKSRNRGKSGRELTIREIKTAICTHDKLRPASPSELEADGSTWRTKLSCPTCGAWYIRETLDALPATTPDQDHVAAVSVA